MSKAWAECQKCHRQFDIVGGNFDPNVGPAPYCQEQECPFRVGPPRDRDEEITRRIRTTPPRPQKYISEEE